MLDIQIIAMEPLTILQLRGALDHANAPRLTEMLTVQLAAGHRNLVLEMDGVSSITSAGLRVLVQGYKSVRTARGDLRLAALSEPVLYTLELTGFSAIFQIYPSREMAVRQYQA